MQTKMKLMKLIFIVSVSIWTFFVLFVSTNSISKNFNYAKELALNEAKISTKKDLAYRTWVASHGGVYVPITQKTPPNPYLSHIQNRDINSTDGQYLTLMNPAYTLSQMMKDYSEFYGTKGHITSKILLNPNNKADNWEKRALDIIENTKKDYYEIVNIENEKYVRLIKPLFTTQECLKCHAHQGYKIGDIRGGVSVSIPTKPYCDEAMKNSIPIAFYFLITWIIGIIVLILGYKKGEKLIKEKIDDYEQRIFNLVDIIEKRDSYTAGHSRRVAEYSILIAKQMKLKESDIDLLRRACMLHDIGKISIPDSILLKPGRLSELEYSIIKEHSQVGWEILSKIDIYSDIAMIIKYHHEHYDGRGYPEGLKGDKIPFLSQIMAVADAFDAMTTNRIYKFRKNVDEALNEILDFSGKQFNPNIAIFAQEGLKNIKIDLSQNQLPKTKLEEARFSYFYKDQTTGAYNKNYLDFMLKNEQYNIIHPYIYGIFLKNFTSYNHKYGWQEGDELLKKVATTLIETLSEAIVFRLFGDDFIVMCRQDRPDKLFVEEILYFLEEKGVGIRVGVFSLTTNKLENSDELENVLKNWEF